MLDGRGHQLVIGRVVLDQVDALAIAVVALEYRLVLVGEKAGDHQLAAGQGAIGIDARLGPAAAEALVPLLQGQIGAVEVGAVQRRHLVEHFMGFGMLTGIHDCGSFSDNGAPTARRQKVTRLWLTSLRLGAG
ncbi:hypothetical protein D3C71_1589590 [compost metagenome]